MATDPCWCVAHVCHFHKVEALTNILHVIIEDIIIHVCHEDYLITIIFLSFNCLYHVSQDFDLWTDVEPCACSSSGSVLVHPLRAIEIAECVH